MALYRFHQVDGGQRLLNLVPTPTWESLPQPIELLRTLAFETRQEVRHEDGGVLGLLLVDANARQRDT